MADAPPIPLRFAPSRVEGLSSVSQVAVWPDRIEFLCAGGYTVTHRFVDLAEWPGPRWLWKPLYRRGVRPKWLPVGERDMFHAPQDTFFEFYTTPRIRVYMPVDDVLDSYIATCFARVQAVLAAGGFHTFDLG